MNNKNININVFRELFKFYKVEYKKLYLLFFVVVISGIIQLSIVPFSIKFLTDNFIISKKIDGFVYAGIVFFVLVIVSTFAIYGFYVLGGMLEYKVSKRNQKTRI